MHFLPENRMCAPPFVTKQRPPHLENPGSATGLAPHLENPASGTGSIYHLFLRVQNFFDLVCQIWYIRFTSFKMQFLQEMDRRFYILCYRIFEMLMLQTENITLQCRPNPVLPICIPLLPDPASYQA